MLPRITLFLAVLASGCSEPRAYCSPALFPISKAAISHSINRALSPDSSLVTIKEDEVELSVVPQARTANPALALVSLKGTTDPGIFWSRLRCRPASDCMSFIVLLRLPVHERECIRQLLAKKPESRTKSSLVPAGTRLNFRCRRGNVLISMQVRSLRSAHVGDQVRVYDDQSGRAYVGRLVAANEVEAGY